MIPTYPIEPRFWGKVIKKDGCWQWSGSKSSDGYGSFSIAHKMYGAHRISWEIHYGQIPQGKHVLHKCDTPECVNPEHLFLGTHKENMRDMFSKGRRKHARGIRNGLAKLNDIKVKEIRRLHKTGKYTQNKIAAKFKVSRQVIGAILKKKTWTHV
jgi:DNA-binding XRE family transcriptional regulator